MNQAAPASGDENFLDEKQPFGQKPVQFLQTAQLKEENYGLKFKLNSRRNKKFRFAKRGHAKFSRPPVVLRI